MSINAASIKRENQHFVLCRGMNGLDRGQYSVVRVYAKTPEQAVEEIRSCFSFDDFGQKQTPPEDCARLAVAWELPWNWSIEAVVVSLHDGMFIEGLTEEQAREVFGEEIASLRRATPEELEKYLRDQFLDGDKVDQMDFERGFEDAKMRLEEGLDA